MVTSVDPEGIADRTGMFRPGDIIRRVNGAEGYQRMAMDSVGLVSGSAS